MHKVGRREWGCSFCLRLFFGRAEWVIQKADRRRSEREVVFALI